SRWGAVTSVSPALPIPAMPANIWNVRIAYNCVSTRLCAAKRGGQTLANDLRVARNPAKAKSVGTTSTAGDTTRNAANGSNHRSGTGHPRACAATPTAAMNASAVANTNAARRAALLGASLRRNPAYRSHVTSSPASPTYANAVAAQGADRWKAAGARTDHTPPKTAPARATKIGRAHV